MIKSIGGGSRVGTVKAQPLAPKYLLNPKSVTHVLSIGCRCNPTVEHVPAIRVTTVADDLWAVIDRLAPALAAASARADKAEAEIERLRLADHPELLAAIEAEARRATLTALREKVTGLPPRSFVMEGPDDEEHALRAEEQLALAVPVDAERLAQVLPGALSLATEQDDTYGYSDEPGSPYVRFLAAAILAAEPRLCLDAAPVDAERLREAVEELLIVATHHAQACENRSGRHDCDLPDNILAVRAALAPSEP